MLYYYLLNLGYYKYDIVSSHNFFSMHLQPLNKTIHSLSPANGNITLGKALSHKPNLGLCLSPHAKQRQNPCIGLHNSVPGFE